jgi:hypothetical protein
MLFFLSSFLSAGFSAGFAFAGASVITGFAFALVILAVP